MAIDSCQFEMVSAVFGQMVLAVFNREFILLLSEWNIWPYFNAHYTKYTQQSDGCTKLYAPKVLQHTSQNAYAQPGSVCIAVRRCIVHTTQYTVHIAPGTHNGKNRTEIRSYYKFWKRTRHSFTCASNETRHEWNCIQLFRLDIYCVYLSMFQHARAHTIFGSKT